MQSAPDADGVIRYDRSAHVHFQPAVARRKLARAELIGLGTAIGNISTDTPSRAWRNLTLAIVAGCALGLMVGAGVETLRWW